MKANLSPVERTPCDPGQARRTSFYRPPDRMAHPVEPNCDEPSGRRLYCLALAHFVSSYASNGNATPAVKP
jgi:hypothetical protein